jgi:O-antigen/teichoic acid export membrane protein
MPTDTQLTPGHHLTQSPLLAKNTILNLIGYGMPALVALFAIPLILAKMGTDRFGLLTLAWVLIGYLSLLDLGLGRALTKLVSEKLGEGSLPDIPKLIWTALCIMFLLSVILGTGLSLLSGWIVVHILTIPAALIEEAQFAFLLLSLFLPVVMIGIGFRGILEAYQRFDMVNSVRIPLGILTFMVPLVVTQFTATLYVVILALLLVRLLAAAVQFLFCIRIVDGMVAGFGVNFQILGKLMGFGGWMTVSNVINPILFYVDRFFIGAFLTVGAVAFYATPGEAIINLVMVSAALMSVMFPAFSASYHVDRPRSAFLLDRSMKYIFMMIFPIVFLVVSFAFEGLGIWLNEEFARNSHRVARMLAIGIFFSCLAQIPYAFVQGAGRPDLTSKLHLIELPCYIILLIPAIQWAGIDGAAFLWALRAFVDMVCMYAMAQKLLGSDKLQTAPKAAGLFSALFFLVLFSAIAPLNVRMGGVVIVMVIFGWVAFRYLLSRDEMAFIKNIRSLV